MNSKNLLVLCIGFASLLYGCGDKKSPTDSPTKASAETTSSVRYLGLRLLDLAQSDPKVSPLPSSLAQEFKECKFSFDEDSNQTSAEGCSIQDLAPTYKQRQNESLDISANTPRCCLGAVTISPNQLTNDITLDIFNGIAGVTKSPVSCKNIEADTGSRNFFVVAVNGAAKFTIQEETDGGSGGSQTTTTVYFGMPTPDCEQISRLEQEKEEKIRAKNLSIANNQHQSGVSGLSSNEQTKKKDILFDPKTGISLNKKSKDWLEGACTGILSIMLDKGELNPSKNTDAQIAWIQSRGKKGANLMSKFTSSQQGTTVFEMLKTGRFTREETEFFAGFLEYRNDMSQADQYSLNLVKTVVCGDAGYSPRL